MRKKIHQHPPDPLPKESCVLEVDKTESTHINIWPKNWYTKIPCVIKGN